MTKPRINVVSAAIKRDGRYLITQRLDKAVLPNLWEFPGGKVERGETDEQALKRELEYRLGVDVAVGQRLNSHEQEYPKYTVQLRLYECDLGPNDPLPINVKDLRWVKSSEFDAYEFTPADEKSMDALLFGK
ncbi:(deoxy)nucleoside triphosphate pyrophosphohydrolase [Myxococcota bacterium]